MANLNSQGYIELTDDDTDALENGLGQNCPENCINCLLDHETPEVVEPWEDRTEEQ